MRSIIVAAVLATLGLAAYVNAASASTCNTTCNTYGNQTYCSRSCY